MSRIKELRESTYLFKEELLKKRDALHKAMSKWSCHVYFNHYYTDIMTNLYKQDWQ